MINKPTIKIDEIRPIERRGRKRASPLIELENSERESLINLLLSLHTYSVEPGAGLTPHPNYPNTLMKDVLTKAGSLDRQIKYKRKNRQ